MLANKGAGVCRLGGVGDDLIITSVLPLLKEKYGRVDVISQSPQCAVFQENPYIDRLIVKAPGDLPGGGGIEWQNWFRDRQKEYEFFVNLSHTIEYRLALFPAQTQFDWPASWRRKHCGQSYLEHTHDVCEVPYIFDPGPRFYPSQEEWDRALETKERFYSPMIGWVLGGTRIDKVHPLGPIIVARLLREIDCSVLLIGTGARDFETAKKIDAQVFEANGTRERLHLALSPEPGGEAQPGQTVTEAMSDPNDVVWPLRRSLTQAQACDLVITPDSGVGWAVAMLDLPKIVLLSHASAENITAHWRNTSSLQADPEKVPCSPCHRLHDSISTCVPNEANTGAACISSITPHEIVETAKLLLGVGRTSAPFRHQDWWTRSALAAE